MIVSPGRNYIFVHIPKTGGPSLALALEARAMKEDLMLGDTPKARQRRGRWADLPPARGRLWKHATLADIEGAIDPDLIDRAFVFTLVRNPWDRLVSYWSWLAAQRFDNPQVRLARSLPFADFVTHPDVAAALRAWPAARYVAGSDGRERPALFIRLEHFAQDAAPLFAHLGFSLDLPRENASDRPADWRGFYDSHLVDHVAEICESDIQRFGYRFDPATNP